MFASRIIENSVRLSCPRQIGKRNLRKRRSIIAWWNFKGKTLFHHCPIHAPLNHFLFNSIQVFKKEKDVKKGIAFPTCLSVNNCICHFSPTKNDPDYELKEGDIVKIDLGAHIDGFIAVAAHTVVAKSDPAAKVKGRAADVILATYWASQAALRLLKPGTGVSQPFWSDFAEPKLMANIFGFSSRTMQSLIRFRKLPANTNASQSKAC